MQRSAADWYRLGNGERDAGRCERAVECFERVVALDPSHAKGWNNLGGAQEMLGRHDAAQRAYRTALEQDPALLQAYANLGHLAESTGDRAGAERWYRAGLERHPGEPSLAHMLAALLGQTTTAPPAGHVAALFDGMAQDFDRLLRSLDYRVPEQLARLALPALKAAAPSARAIDVGCGTGLMGVALAGSGAQVLGIDLSAGMLEQAARCGAYAELIHGELVAELGRVAPASAHAVIAADVFIYFGDLDPAYGAAARALAPSGVFVFSVEEMEGAPFQLQPNGRYAHSVAYLRSLAAQRGLVELAMEPVGLRREGTGYAPGRLACFARPAGR
jgi:predicted TPR repeat methyltransferase